MVQFFTDKAEVRELGVDPRVSSNFQLFRTVQFTAKDIEVSYRELNHWSKLGLIDDERQDNENGWRKFSLAGLVWVEVVKELRGFGISIATIEKAKDALLKPKAQKTDIDLVNAIARCVATQKPMFLVVANENSKIMLAKEFLGDFCKEYQAPFFTIRLDQLLSRLLPDLNWEASKNIPDSDELTKSEKKAIDLIRDGSFERVSALTKQGKIQKLETLTTTKKTHEILELINKVSFGEYTVKKQNGEIVFAEIIQVEKIND